MLVLICPEHAEAERESRILPAIAEDFTKGPWVVRYTVMGHERGTAL